MKKIIYAVIIVLFVLPLVAYAETIYLTMQNRIFTLTQGAILLKSSEMPLENALSESSRADIAREINALLPSIQKITFEPVPELNYCP